MLKSIITSMNVCLDKRPWPDQRTIFADKGGPMAIVLDLHQNMSDSDDLFTILYLRTFLIYMSSPICEKMRVVLSEVE